MAQIPKGISIRPMVIGDYEQVFAMWIHTPGMGLHAVDDTREGIEKYLRRNPSMSFVAADGDEVVGVLLSGHDGRRGTMYHLAVKPENRRSGIGKALVEAALDVLRKDGISKVMLVVFRKNDLGKAFWEQFGSVERDDLSIRSISLD